MKILAPTPQNIEQAARALQAGELVAMPTETVYGLAGDALNPDALAKIFNTKERPTFDPLIVHICDEIQNTGLVDFSKLSPTASSRLEKLTARFWPGPLTIVVPKTSRVPDLATSGLPNVAIRMPRHAVAQALLRAAGRPLAAPSANRFGRISPTRAEHVLEELGDRIDWILDGGPCEIGVESTVLRIMETGELIILRPGGVTAAQIAEATGVAPLVLQKSTAQAAPQLGPGMLESHYAPVKKLLALASPVAELATLPSEISRAKSLGVLVVSGEAKRAREKLEKLSGVPVIALSLSVSGDPAEMARNLFSTLRELDHSNAELLLAEPSPEGEGLHHAIADRLRRACAPRD